MCQYINKDVHEKQKPKPIKDQSRQYHGCHMEKSQVAKTASNTRLNSFKVFKRDGDWEDKRAFLFGTISLMLQKVADLAFDWIYEQKEAEKAVERDAESECDSTTTPRNSHYASRMQSGWLLSPKENVDESRCSNSPLPENDHFAVRRIRVSHRRQAVRSSVREPRLA
jgi:hypothetical protein